MAMLIETKTPPLKPLGKKETEVIPQATKRHYVWQVPIRLTHWVNALAIPVLFFTGLFIATPFFSPTPGEAFERFTMGHMREFHFIFGYVLLLSIAVRVYWFFVGNNYARSGFPFFWKPSWYKAVIHQMIEYMHLERGYVNIGHNSLAGCSYAGFFALCGFEGVTGLALLGEGNPGGFWDRVLGWTTPLLGGSFRVHMWHHLAAWFIILIAMFHIYIVLYDSHLYKDGLVDSIISGEKHSIEGDKDANTWIS
ncbi:MAG: Ni/Fe-hydrogenase, b-type cytochrome subunit [Acidobacteriia bacterium]|nr:Ni/Fe-hydrogenase, b-type cytochrome subunit [Terriglobia bacterium]